MWLVHHLQGYLPFFFSPPLVPTSKYFYFHTGFLFFFLFFQSSKQPDDNHSLSLAVFHAKIRMLLLRRGSCTLPPPFPPDVHTAGCAGTPEVPFSGHFPVMLLRFTL